MRRRTVIPRTPTPNPHTATFGRGAHLLAGAGVIAALVLAGCSPSHHASAAPAAATGSSSITSSSTAASTTSGPSSNSDPAAAVPDGPTLKQALPAANSLPAGQSIDVSASDDSGANTLTEQDLSTPVLPGSDCRTATNAGADSLLADFKASYATETINNSSQSGITLEAVAFNPGDLSKQLAEISAFLTRCASFKTADTDGRPVTMTAASTPIAGVSQGLDINIKATVAGYDSTELLLLPKGDRLVAADFNPQTQSRDVALRLATTTATALGGLTHA